MSTDIHILDVPQEIPSFLITPSATITASPTAPLLNNSFPLSLPASASLPPTSRSVSATGPELLLVEDVRGSQKVAAQALTRAHFRVEATNDGESAVEKYKQHYSTLKIILMDIGLPGITGVEATERIRSLEKQLHPTGKILIFGLTGNVDFESMREYEEVGMNGCIAKGSTQLAETVKKTAESANKMPGQFINSVKKGEDTVAALPTAQFAPTPANLPSQPPVRSHANIHSDGAFREGNFDMYGTALPSTIGINRVIANENLTGVGTPKVSHPSQIMKDRFSGSGVVKPGIGLPSVSTSPTTMPSTEPSNAHFGSKHNTPDVLLVEDVKISQKVAHQALQSAHYKVDIAADGQIAVERYKLYHNSIKIILMDVGLPVMSGIEATEKIRKLESDYLYHNQIDRPVLIFGLTGNVGEGNLRQYQEAGMNGCIVKGTLLVDAVKEACVKIESNPTQFVNLVGGTVE